MELIFTKLFQLLEGIFSFFFFLGGKDGVDSKSCIKIVLGNGNRVAVLGGVKENIKTQSSKLEFAKSTLVTTHYTPCI